MAAPTEPLLMEDVDEVASIVTKNRSLHLLALKLQQGPKPQQLSLKIQFTDREFRIANNNF